MTTNRCMECQTVKVIALRGVRRIDRAVGLYPHCIRTSSYLLYWPGGTGCEHCVWSGQRRGEIRPTSHSKRKLFVSRVSKKQMMHKRVSSSSWRRRRRVDGGLVEACVNVNKMLPRIWGQKLPPPPPPGIFSFSDGFISERNMGLMDQQTNTWSRRLTAGLGSTLCNSETFRSLIC